MQIRVVGIVGKNALTPEDGKNLYSKIRPELDAGNQVALDFSGVEVFSSPFFNWGIAQLIADYTSEDLNQRLTFENLEPAGHQALLRSIENAKEYYSANEKDRNAIDEAVQNSIAL